MYFFQSTNITLRTFFTCLLLSFLLISCRQGYRPSFEETKEFTVLLNSNGEQVRILGRTNYLKTVDSFFRTYTGLSFKDSCNYYVFKCDFIWDYYQDTDACLAYADTLKQMLLPYKALPQAVTLLAKAHYLAGDAYYRKNNYIQTFQEYLAARLLGQEVLDLCILSDYSYRMAMILYRQDRFQESLLYFKECLNRLQECNYSDNPMRHYFTQEVLGNIALCYDAIREPDSAIAFYHRAMEYQNNFLPKKTDREKELYYVCRAVSLGNLARSYENKEQYGIAEKLYKESAHTNFRYKYEVRHAVNISMKLANLYYNTGRLDKMYQTLSMVGTVLDTMYSLTSAKWWNYYMAKYYDAQAHPGYAYTYLSKYEQLRDSLESSYLSLRTLDLKEHIKSIEREQDIILLERNNQRKQWFLFITVVLTGISIIVIIFIIYSMKRMRRYMNMLGKANKRINKQKRTLNATLLKLEKINQEKDRILRVVAHDLRSPIAAIHALADISLQEEDPPLPEAHKENIQLIKTASEQAMTLSSEILESASVITRDSLSLKIVDLNAIILQHTELLRFRAAEKKQEIRLALLEGPAMALADKEKIGRVINNLVTNAIKFSKTGNIIQMSSAKENGNFIFSITDTGIGIPEQIKERVFDIFTTAKRSGTNGEKAYGLGLSISRQIITAHGGQIWFDSNEQQGTTFYFSLPLAS